MIKTWIADIRPLCDPDRYMQYYKNLPDFRKEKARRIQQHKGKMQSIGAWSLLEMIRKEYGITDEAAFNLSHSGDYVLCSVDIQCRSGILAGCDIEQIKDADLKVAQRFFCPSEYEEIMRQPGKAERNDRFYRFWVLKESFMKATRMGMALDMRSFEIQLADPPVLLRKPERFREPYYYREYALPHIPYKIAICSTDRVIDSEIQTELIL